MNYDKIPPPIWTDGGKGEQTAYEIIVDLIEAHRSDLPELSERQFDELVQVMWSAMDRGWAAAIMYSRMRTVRQSQASRAKKTDATRKRIRDTYTRMVNESPDVTMSQVAAACGVSVATAYRAMSPKRPVRSK